MQQIIVYTYLKNLNRFVGNELRELGWSGGTGSYRAVEKVKSEGGRMWTDGCDLAYKIHCDGDIR